MQVAGVGSQSVVEVWGFREAPASLTHSTHYYTDQPLLTARDSHTKPTHSNHNKMGTPILKLISRKATNTLHTHISYMHTLHTLATE